MVGRVRERAQLDRLMAEATAGRGGSLVLRGEVGIGKSFLLRYAEQAATEAGAMRVLRTDGTAPETELGYAGLHRLLRPVQALITVLPAPQQVALRTVLGLQDGPSPDRFLVGLGVLTLLSEATADPARRGPLLCVIDDAHWLDGPTREALGFVARRIEAEPVALIFAERAEAGDDALAGLPVMPLSGLDRAAAAALLAARAAAEPIPWSAAEQDAVLRATGGNPLALTELPLADLPRIRAGEPVPLGDELRRAFLDRLQRCSADDRTVLLLVAAAGAISANTLAAAADRLGVPANAAALAELIKDDGGELTCRHPLIRSASYGDADPDRLRAVHAALADAYAATPDADAADRRAWHLGRSVTGIAPDAADELERAGAAALHRAGPGTAQTLLLRAAELSPDDVARDRRLIAAADAAVQVGDPERAIELLAGTQQGDPVETGRLRGQIELRRGQPADALDLLEPVLDAGLAAEALARDPDRVVRLVMVYGEAAFQANRAEPYARLADELERLPLDELDGPPGVLLRMLRGSCRVRTGAAPGLRPDDLDRLAELDDPYRLCWAGGLLWGLGDPGAGRRLRRAAMQRARELGAAGALAWVLDYVVVDEVGDCRYDLAEAYAEEGRRFAEETGQPTTACRHLAWLALLASLRGREADATELAEAALGAAERHRLASAAAVAGRALGLLHLAAGRPADALRQLSALDRGDAGHPGIRLFSFADLVEAAVRAGEPDRARATYQRFLTWSEAGAAPELLALGTRARALLTDGEPALAAYREALAQHAEGGQPFEEARTRLLYGEQLRRDRRPSDARAELRAAADAFRRLGATGWAERAATELRAAGGSAGSPGPADDSAPALDGLSPQELRIALGVGEGLTNREIAAQLFLSPRTVDYHLRKVFQKLQISSRAELIKLAPRAQP